MNRDDFLQQQYEVSVTAGMNQRYHQSRASLWGKWDRAIRIAVGLSAVASAMLAGASITANNIWLTGAGVALAVLSAVLGVVLNVFPVKEMEMRSNDFFRRWTDLREEIDALEFDLGENDPTPALIAQLARLSAKVHRISGEEPKGSPQLINNCYKAEVASRQFDETTAAAA